MKLEDKSKIQTSIIERLSENITYRINKHLNKEGLDLIKMKFGIEVLLINISKFSIVLILSAALNLLMESIIIILSFASLRRTAFGLHAKSSIVCTICCIGMFVGGPYLSHYLKPNNLTIVIIHTIIIFLVYMYAPADTEKRPLIGSDLRSTLKKNSILCCLFFAIINLIISSYVIKNLIVLGEIFEIFTILPITYKILGREYNNYENFE